MQDLARLSFGLGADRDAERLTRLGRHCFGERCGRLAQTECAGTALMTILDESGCREPCRIITSGGESPALVGEIASAIGRLEHDLVLIPPTAEGLADEPSLHRALHSKRTGTRTLFVCGVTSAYGMRAPLERWSRFCRQASAMLVLDMTPAVLSEQIIPSLEGVTGVLAQVRHTEGTTQRWAYHRPESEVFGGLGDGHAVRRISALDRQLRSALAEHTAVHLFVHSKDPAPLPNTHAPGLAAFSIRGWSAKEASAVLDECFSLEIDPGPLSAVPLPFPRGAARREDPLRAILSPEHDAEDIAFLSEAIARLAATSPASCTSH